VRACERDHHLMSRFSFCRFSFACPTTGCQVVTINGARVIRPNIQAKNGMIHIVDRVIFNVPQADIYNTLKGDKEQRYSTLVSAIERAGLVPVLANPQGMRSLRVHDPSCHRFLSIGGAIVSFITAVIEPPLLERQLMA